MPAPPAGAGDPVFGELPARIGPYAILRRLGAGGMGVVYAAQDERLGRAVAIKTMAIGGDESARKRFWREARAAASVNHPNICQIYEIGEDRGGPFIAMELLAGETLSDRLGRGPLGVAESLTIGLGMLGALGALHDRGIVHRDLKPSNVFLTPHGVKLLDFGLARTHDGGPQALGSLTDLTGSGMVVGTPRYMAPEQVTGESLDGRTDLFAAGAILFEMLAGRPAFDGGNVVEVLHATLHAQPPALTGSPAVAAMDRVIRHALAKRPSERPASAAAMAGDLRASGGLLGDDSPVVASALTRIVVMPFRILRPDPETDFLAFSLPDAIATSLARFGSLIVRSSAAAARFGAESPDLKALAVEADVDRVLMGTLLRSGDQLQASTQLVEAPGGTLLNSHRVLSPLGDLFRLQDDIVERVVDALALPLGRGSASPAPDAPLDAQAYRLYLQANDLARSFAKFPEARDLYRACLEREPGFARAWAQLARCERVIAKFIEPSGDGHARAEEALRRALEIDPRLSIAHKLTAAREAETGRAREAMVRLLTDAGRRGNDAELIAGLVHACRYCGLFDQSIAAHYEARRLDPNVATSFEQTLVMTGDIERLLALEPRRGELGGDQMIRVIGLGLAGRRDEARRRLAAIGEVRTIAAFRVWTDLVRAWLERRPADMRASLVEIEGLAVMDDPEALFSEAWMVCDVGDHERGLELLRRAIDRGFFAAPTLARSPQFDALRSSPAFQALLAEAQAARDLAWAAYREAGGEHLLGA